MASGAIRREPAVLAGGRALVTRAAFEEGVRSQQRKAVLVLAYGLHGNRPPRDRVALLALRAHLPAVNVGVTIGALFPDIGEHRLGVTLRARHALVHAAQRIARGVVVELWHIADGLPSGERVAVLARNGERTMRTARARRGPALRLRRHWRSERHRQQEKQSYCNRRDHGLSLSWGPTALRVPGISPDEGELADLMNGAWSVMRSANQFAHTDTVAAYLLGKKVTELRCTRDQWRARL